MNQETLRPKDFNRREALKLAGAALAAGVLAPPSFAASRRPKKKVIVAGAGIGGSCCAYELWRRGHDVTLLEASDHVGGHVLSTYEPFADGLYADLGAEHCSDPGYDLYRAYAKQLGVTLLSYRRRDHVLRYIGKKPYTEEMLADRTVLAGFGYNPREVEYMATHGFLELPNLFFSPYFDKFGDENQPFGVGLDELDHMSVPQFLRREHASAAAARSGGGGSSALQELWRLAIYHREGRPQSNRNLFRVRGGNQQLPLAFAAKLGHRVQLNCPITRIQYGDTGATVHYDSAEGKKSMDADYLVNAIALPLFSTIPVEPDWPAAKAWVLQNVTYSVQSRVVFQCRTRFWKEENIVPNIDSADSRLHDIWEMANEVPGERGLLMSSANAGTTSAMALEAFKQYYPGKKIDIEKVYLKEWYRDPWAPRCSRMAFAVGQLNRFWPNIVEPCGRIHFVGAYADNVHGGQEAATRSAHRVASQIDEL